MNENSVTVIVIGIVITITLIRIYTTIKAYHATVCQAHNSPVT